MSSTELAIIMILFVLAASVAVVLAGQTEVQTTTSLVEVLGALG